MGGEGASWIGQSPFVKTSHIFQNIGDGTYFHSGILAIRAAIASGVNITYKILYNDAVAMTGGQPVDGTLTLAQIVDQVRAEGVKRIAVVSEDVDSARSKLASYRDITLHPKRDFAQLQSEIREVKGTSVIVFDQTCASEKRRRRKRGLMPESDTRVYINSAVCEGCGDCSSKSNCLSVIPKSTELGIKRQIDQNACNKDMSCVEGFCPSFVTVHGASLKKPAVTAKSADLEIVVKEPNLPVLEQPWNMLVTGIGGTGVLTVGSIVAMAAHLEGKGCSTLNQTGLAQKFGSVVSHVKVAADQDSIHAVRIPAGDADLLLGCDLVVSASADALAKLNISRSKAIVNSYETATADFIHDKNYAFPSEELRGSITQEAGDGNAEFVDATRIARDLLGDTIASNLFLLGYAYQRELVPVSSDAINHAIKLNGVAIELNQSAFLWGRRAAVNLDAVISQLGEKSQTPKLLSEIRDIVQWRYDFLVDYQDSSWAERYQRSVDEIAQCEPDQSSGALTEAYAKSLFRLMSYKDEYEVARLYSSPEFMAGLNEQFDGPFKIKFHMAPPLISKINDFDGLPMKRQFPGFTLSIFKLLAKLKGLRGGRWDLFGKSSERQTERQLIVDYEQMMKNHLKEMDQSSYDRLVELAELPQMIKGFGHVKEASIRQYRERLASLERQLVSPELKVVING